VNVYFALAAVARQETVLALSSSFMTYRPDVHPEYERCRRDVASSPSTFVLLPSLDLEACVVEIVRRQISRPFARSAEREEEVIRARFPIYVDIPARKVATMRPVRQVVDEVVDALADRAAERALRDTGLWTSAHAQSVGRSLVLPIVWRFTP
jgi:hypothetical protein